MRSWDHDETATKYRPGHRDASPAVFASRLAACDGCPSRQNTLCGEQGQLCKVVARPVEATCPLGRWGETPAEPEPEPLEIQRLAVLTTYFNPCGYRRLLENYHRFAAGMAAVEAELWTIELAFDDDPFAIDDPHVIRV